jgi:hypothetical protein
MRYVRIWFELVGFIHIVALQRVSYQALLHCCYEQSNIFSSTD